MEFVAKFGELWGNPRKNKKNPKSQCVMDHMLQNGGDLEFLARFGALWGKTNTRVTLCCIDIEEGMALTWNLYPHLESFGANQEKYKSVQKSHCVMHHMLQNGGGLEFMAKFGGLWGKTNTRVTLRRGSGVAWTSKKEWRCLGICSQFWRALGQTKKNTTVYKSHTASWITCCTDIKDGMVVTWNLWPNLESYGARQIQE